MRVFQKSGRNFFVTPLFPLEIFAQNEKYRVISKKYYGEVAERKYTSGKNLKKNKTSLIIFTMLLIFLTGNFSNPYISTGTHFFIFYLKIFGFITASIS